MYTKAIPCQNWIIRNSLCIYLLLWSSKLKEKNGSTLQVTDHITRAISNLSANNPSHNQVNTAPHSIKAFPLWFRDSGMLPWKLTVIRLRSEHFKLYYKSGKSLPQRKRNSYVELRKTKTNVTEHTRVYHLDHLIMLTKLISNSWTYGLLTSASWIGGRHVDHPHSSLGNLNFTSIF